MRTRGRWIQGAVVLLVLALTLSPSGELIPEARWCFLCGDSGLADFLLNVALFVPLGLAFARRAVPVVRVIAAGVALSMAIEVLQWVIPGRHPSYGDIVANALGAWLGAEAWRAAGSLLDPTPAQRTRLLWQATVLAVLLQAAVPLLIRPSFPHADYYGQWTPEREHMESYRGHILNAGIAGEGLPNQRLAHSARVRHLVLDGALLHLDGVAGPPPRGLSTLFSIADEYQRLILRIGIQGEDILFRYRSVAEELELERVQVRLHGILGGVVEGDTLKVHTWYAHGRWCASGPRQSGCDGFNSAALGRMVAPRTTRWGLLIDLIWMTAVFLPLGYWGTGSRGWLAAMVAIVPLVVMPALPIGVLFSLTALAGAALGLVSGRSLSVARARHSLRSGTRPA